MTSEERKLYYKKYYEKNKKRIALKRKNKLKTHKCIDCGKLCWNTAKRCHICSLIKRNKSKKFRKKMSKIMKGRNITWYTGSPLSEEHKKAIGNAQRGTKRTQKQKDKISKTLKRRYKNGEFPVANKKIHRHHIDLDTNNNNSENHMRLSANLHRKIHARAYNYLVKIGKIKEYVEDFKQEFSQDFRELEERLDNLEF